MSTIRITSDCFEFGQSFTAGQLVSALSPMHDLALVSSGLASYAGSGVQISMPFDGVVPITSLQFNFPAAYGLNQYSRRFYEYEGDRYWWDGVKLVGSGRSSTNLTAVGIKSVGAVQVGTLRGAVASGFQWYRVVGGVNGVGGVSTPIAGATNIDSTGTLSNYTMTAPDLVPGVEVRLRPTGLVLEASLGVAAAVAPTTSAPTFSSPPAVGSVVAFAAGAATGSPAPTITYSMTVYGVTVAMPYTPVAGDSGRAIVLTQIATNAGGAVSASVSATIAAAPPGPTPVNSVLPAITGTAAQGSTLTATPGTWTQTPTFTYQWSRSGAAIVGATGATYLLAAADVSYTITCTVTANALGVTATATSAATAAIAGAPVAPTITAQPTAQAAVSPASATFSVVASGTAVLTYQWQRNGTAIAGATSASFTTPATTLTGGAANNADTFRCVVTNGVGSATSNAVALTVTVSTVPLYGIGIANAWTAGPAALLASMLPIPGAANGSKVGGPFTCAPTGVQYGWVAVLASVSAGGVTFTDALGAGGWLGAGLAGQYSGASPSLSTSTTLYTDANGTTWRLFRQDYASATFTGSIT